MKIKIYYIFILVLLLGYVSANDFGYNYLDTTTTSGNISNYNNITYTNVTNNFIGGNLTFNQSLTDELYISQSDEPNLNVNSSTWWSGLTGWISGWFFSVGNEIQFNETKLNLTIDARASGLGGNSSFNQTLTDSLYSNKTNLTQLNDVNITSPVNHEMLSYDVESGLWANKLLNEILINTQGWFGFSGPNEVFFNEVKLNESIDARATGDNESWNQSFANTLYADIIWGYNMSDGSYNETYDLWAYNQTTATYNLYNDIWSSTYNETYASHIQDNSSWNETYANDLYVNIDGDNMTGNLNNSGNITANDFIIPAMKGNNNYESLNDAFNLFNSAGRLTGGEIVNGTGISVIVTAGEGVTRIADDDISQVKFIGWENSSEINIPTNTIMYFGIDYNSGSPIVINTTDESDFDLDTSFPLGSAINQYGEIYILNNPWWVGDGLTNVIERFQGQGYLVRDENIGGLILGVTGTRNPTMTAGSIWGRLIEHAMPSFDSSVGDTFDTYYRDGADGYSEIPDQTQYNVTHYDDGSGTLKPLGNNQYAVIWVWANIGSQEIAIMYPQAQYPNVATAEAEEIPNTFPAIWYKQGIIIGRIIIQKGQDAPVEVQSVFTQTFTPALAADHGNLAGLEDDDHTQYLLTDGSRTVTGNLTTTNWFNGLFNWTTIGGWFGWNGATLSFNETKLNESINYISSRITKFFITEDMNQVLSEDENNTIITYNATNPNSLKQIIGIGIDGVSVKRLNDLIISGDMGNLSLLVSDGGINTTANITQHTLTATAPGNSEILTGLGEEQTGIYTNENASIISLEDNLTVFEKIENNIPSIATIVIYGKNTTYIPLELLANAEADVDEWFNTPSDLDDFLEGKDSRNVSQKACEYISTYKNQDFFIWIYYGVPDETGHVYGDNSTEYNQSITNIDDGLGVLIDCLTTEGIYDNVDILGLADHGWHENSTTHANTSDYNFPDTIEIPIFAKNSNLISRYSDVRQQCSFTPTILDYFGLEENTYEDSVDLGCLSMIESLPESRTVTIANKLSNDLHNEICFDFRTNSTNMTCIRNNAGKTYFNGDVCNSDGDCLSDINNTFINTDNSSWNQSFADTLYAPIDSIGGNASWNETYADTLYADIIWGYNMSDGSYNETYDLWAYNQTTATYNLYNDVWSSTYNETYASHIQDNSSWNQSFADTLYAPIDFSGGNSSWNQTFANTLYSDIIWGYNQTTETYNLYNDIWSSTYNATYDLWAYNQTYSGSTYNATYDAKVTDNESWNEVYADGLYLKTVADDSVLIKSNNITNLPTCTGTERLFSDGSLFTCLETSGGDGAGNLSSTNGVYLYDDGEIVYFNETKLNLTITDLAGSGSGGNSSFNQTLTDGLYAGIEWAYNQTTATYNLYNDVWSSTYNATYDALISYNLSFNQTLTDGLYADIIWGYNQTEALNVNETQMEFSNGYLNILQSWIESVIDSIFGTKTTDDLIEGVTNLYNNNTFNQTLTDSLYSPGGSDTQIQFNDGGAFNGSVNMTFDKTQSILNIISFSNITGIHRVDNGTAIIESW